MMEIKEIKIDQLREQYNECYDNNELVEKGLIHKESFYSYTKRCADVETNFFHWLFDLDEIDWAKDGKEIKSKFTQLLVDLSDEVL